MLTDGVGRCGWWLVCAGQDFGIESVRLMTNNPFKVRSLQALDVVVSNVVPHQVGEAGPRLMLLAGWGGSEREARGRGREEW